MSGRQKNFLPKIFLSEWASKNFRVTSSRPRIFSPCVGWAAKIFSVKSHLTPPPPVINNDRSLNPFKFIARPPVDARIATRYGFCRQHCHVDVQTSQAKLYYFVDSRSRLYSTAHCSASVQFHSLFSFICQFSCSVRN